MTTDQITNVRIAALALLAGMFCSWPLWDVQVRAFGFPVLPLIESWGPVSGGVARWMAVFMTLLLGVVVFFPLRRMLIGCVIAFLALLCILDLNRLQPWVWLYLLVFVLAFFDSDDASYRYLLAAVYFWSGFHKLTPYFAEDNFQWFCSAFPSTEPLGHYPILGYAIALLEMSFAFGLLWSRTRRWIKWVVISFHTVILLALSPLGYNWNLVVVPWNLAIMALVWVQSRPPAQSDQKVAPLNARFQGFHASGLPGYLVLLLACGAPALNIAGLWPHPLSWQLYTNTQPEGTFYVQGQATFRTRPAAEVWNHFTSPDDSTRLYLDDWAMRSLQVPLFPSERTFRQTAKYLCGCLQQPDSTGLYILRVNRWDRSAEQVVKIPCPELLKSGPP